MIPSPLPELAGRLRDALQDAARRALGTELPDLHLTAHPDPNHARRDPAPLTVRQQHRKSRIHHTHGGIRRPQINTKNNVGHLPQLSALTRRASTPATTDHTPPKILPTLASSRTLQDR